MYSNFFINSNYFNLLLYKEKKKSKMSLPNFEFNKINFKNSGLKLPYNKRQNTSNINPNLNPNNNISMSEAKIQNLKGEINNIITHSFGSNSSGRRKREKKEEVKIIIKYLGILENKGIKKLKMK